MHIPPPPPPVNSRAVMDIECYTNWFLVKFMRTDTRQVIGEFELFAGMPLDVAGITSILRTHTIITFNGNSYDMPMLAAALLGYDCTQLKFLSDQIIVNKMRPWDIARQFNISVPQYIDHIDLIEVMPGQHGLKMYGGKMHSRRIQDLPIEPRAMITPDQRALLREYCGNDLITTCDALELFDGQIRLRERLGRKYGLDLRSKSDAQIAEAVIKSELGFYVERPVWAIGTHFQYDVPAFIQYRTALLQDLLAMVRRVSFTLGPNAVEMPPELEAAKIKIGNSTYRMGIGGLHSSESSIYHVSDDQNELSDHDVASYYPRIFLNLKLYPPQIGPAFLRVFGGIVDLRLAAKSSFQELEHKFGKMKAMAAAIRQAYDDFKAEADGVKIVINGTFGKTLSKYGILSAPKLGIQTTITGQLSLLMLIEMLELCNIPVVSANTDGIVVKCPRPLAWLRDQIIRDWETATGFETEATRYMAIYSRDVNNYIAVKDATNVKLKGEYARPVPVGGSWPNPTGEVCIDAIVAYLLNGTPLDQTIRACQDVRKFVYIRNVKGGGQWLERPEREKVTTKGGMREALLAAGWRDANNDTWSRNGSFYTMKDAYKLALQQLRQADNVQRQYLGKVARWYYAKDSQGLITYTGSGNKVAKTEGCKPLMELPDSLPLDVDYDWYVREAKSMLTDLGMAMI